MNQFLNYGLLFCSSVDWGHPIIILLFFLWLIVKRWRNEMTNLLVTVNVLLLICLFIGFIQMINSVRSWYGHSDYEWYAFRYKEPFSVSMYYSMMIMTTASMLLLLFRAFRRSWPFSFYLLLILHLDTIQLWLTKLFRNYLPSSWQAIDHSYWPARITYSLIFTVSLAIMYTILASTNSLPFTSSLNFIRRTDHVQ